MIKLRNKTNETLSVPLPWTKEGIIFEAFEIKRFSHQQALYLLKNFKESIENLTEKELCPDRQDKDTNIVIENTDILIKSIDKLSQKIDTLLNKHFRPSWFRKICSIIHK